MKGTRFRAAVLVTTQNVINATSRHDTVSFMLVYRPGSHALAYRRNRLGLVWAKYFGFEIRFEIIIDRDQSPQAMAATAAALDASQPYHSPRAARPTRAAWAWSTYGQPGLPARRSQLRRDRLHLLLAMAHGRRPAHRRRRRG
jgi:hypothetical protein